MEDEEEIYIFEMIAHWPGREARSVVFKSKDEQHFLRTIKGVENALFREENESLGEINSLPNRKAHIYKLARKLALQMIKDGAFQADLFS